MSGTEPQIHQPSKEAADPSGRIRWTATSDDLHVNLVALDPGEEIGTHVNAQLDVLLTCLEGEGTLSIDRAEVPLRPGTIAVIPRGAARRTVAGASGLRYTTCHRRRGGIMPLRKRPLS